MAVCAVKDLLAGRARRAENAQPMRPNAPFCTVAAAALFAFAVPAAAAPLVLYDAGSAGAAANADLKASTTTQAPQTCGLTTPCTDLNTAAGAHYAMPFASGIQYGMSGEVSAGVSNHGEGGSIGVLGWVKPTEDTMLYLGLSLGTSRWNGQKITVVPVTPRP